MYAHTLQHIRNHSTILFIVGLAAILTAAVVAANIGQQPRAVVAPVVTVPGSPTLSAARERFAEHKQQESEQAMDAAMTAPVLTAPTTREQFRALKEQRAAQAMDAATLPGPAPTSRDASTPAEFSAPISREDFAWLMEQRAEQRMDAPTRSGPTLNPAKERFAAIKQLQAELATDR